MYEEIKKAKEILEQGGIIIYPTDTAFGIGCRIDNEKAVKRLFTIKKRSEIQATPVLVDSIAMAQQYTTEISPEARKLMEAYWPGALTIVLQSRTEKVLPLIRGGLNTVGMRMPDHQIPLRLIKAVGVPIIGTSANFHGGKTPYSFADIDPELIKHVDLVIPGKCSLKQSSTVIDCSVSPWKILREGAVTISI